jgi:hypothetical protein
MEEIITDNSKVNQNLIKQNKELLEALKDTHNLYIQAMNGKCLTHYITRMMSNETIFQKYESDLPPTIREK